MTQPLQLGVIGGGGWLGGAIVGAALAAGIATPERLALSYRSRPSSSVPDAFWTRDNQAVADRSDLVVLSVRPADWPALSFSAAGKLVVSVMASIRIADIAQRLGTDRVVRALPNAAAEVRCSYTPWFAGSGLAERDRDAVRILFSACGTEDEVADESDIDYLTGLSGSGPAFPALLAAAMMRDAVANGIAPAVARRAVDAMLVGAGRLVEARGESPDRTVEAFVAYRGTTAAAIEAMQAGGFDSAVGAGLAAALRKARALS